MPSSTARTATRCRVSRRGDLVSTAAPSFLTRVRSCPSLRCSMLVVVAPVRRVPGAVMDVVQVVAVHDRLVAALGAVLVAVGANVPPPVAASR